MPKTGRPPIGKRAMTDAERQRRRRERLKQPTAAAAPKPAAKQPQATTREAALATALESAKQEIERQREREYEMALYLRKNLVPFAHTIGTRHGLRGKGAADLLRRVKEKIAELDARIATTLPAADSRTGSNTRSGK